jgi:hypothetical protein
MWGVGMGVKLCHLYRLLFSAALMGVVVALAALFLDIMALRRMRVVAKYVRAEMGGTNGLEGHLDMEIDTGYRSGSGSDTEGLLYDPPTGGKGGGRVRGV